MHAEQAVVAAVRVEVGSGDVSVQVERAVQRQGGVPLREHDAVTVRVVGILRLEDAVVEQAHDVGDRHRGPDVPDVSSP